jgi:hypothetical protein
LSKIFYQCKKADNWTLSKPGVTFWNNQN